MPAELTLSLNFNYAKNGVTILKAIDSIFDIASNFNMTGVVSIAGGGGTENLPIGDIPTSGIGYLFIRNIDDPLATPPRIVEIGDGTINPISLSPPQWMIAPWKISNITCRVPGTNAVLLEYAVLGE